MPNLERIAFHSEGMVFNPGDPCRYVYFPEDTIVSLLAMMADGRSAEVSLIGAEGILGIHGMLGGHTYSYAAHVEVPGSAVRMETKVFTAEFQRGGLFQTRTLSYLDYLVLQISQMAACNRLHRVRQRFARRLLMIQDRVGKDEFPMTHESLSYVLGTPRSEVSLAAESLRRSGSIQYARGKVKILSRSGLESASCECYQVIHRRFLSLE